MNYKYIISPSAGRWQATGNGVAGSLTIEIETDSVSPESSWLWDWMNAQADALSTANTTRSRKAGH